MEYCMFCMEPIGKGKAFCPFCRKKQEYETPLHQLAVGTILNKKFLIGAALGEGGFGITYIGRDTLLDMKVAIKEYFPSGYVNRSNTISQTLISTTSAERKEFFEKGLERFLMEARILAKFSDEDGIVEVRDFFEENNTAYIVMEYLDGQTLKDYLEENGTLTPEQTIKLLTPVMLSLKNIHQQELVHRDISPDNIMLVKGKVKLLDFGAARIASAASNRSLSIVLKPGYAPEEQYRSKGVQGPWTDIYALCATMYKCITGITPDDSNERVHDDELKAPSELGIRIEPVTEKALMKGLSVLYKDRYRSIDGLLNGLNGVDDKTVLIDSDNPTIGLKESINEQKTFEQSDTYEELDTFEESVALDKKQQQEIHKTNHTELLDDSTKALNSTISGTKDDNEENKKHKIGFWLLGIIIALIVGVAAVIVITSKGSTTEEKTLETTPVSKLTDVSNTEQSPTTTTVLTPSATPIQEISLTPTLTPSLTEAPMLTLGGNAGDIITFGSYEQDNNLSNGSEPVEWIVLSNDGDKMLLLSKYALASKPYNEQSKSTTWEKCTLRGWLNEDFYNTAFNNDEKILIRKTALSNYKNPTYGTGGGNDTSDMVFIPSMDDIKKYIFSSSYSEHDINRRCAATAYAVAQGVYTAENYKDGEEFSDDYLTGEGDYSCWWWLRTPGGKSNLVTGIYSSGHVDEYGDYANKDVHAVRPAICVSLNPPTPKPTPTPIKSMLSIDDVDVGDVITFGSYEQDNDFSNGTEPIQWIVLSNDGERVLLFSRYVLDSKAYNEQSKGITWENCSLRAWLNDNFYYTAFNNEERELIRKTHVKNNNNPSYGTKGGNDTEDNVFLLSIEEVKKNQFSSSSTTYDTNRRCAATAYAVAQGTYTTENYKDNPGFTADYLTAEGEYSCWWWLRSPGGKTNLGAGIRSQGDIDEYGDYIERDLHGVRPAIYVTL